MEAEQRLPIRQPNVPKRSMWVLGFARTVAAARAPLTRMHGLACSWLCVPPHAWLHTVTPSLQKAIVRVHSPPLSCGCRLSAATP